MCATCGCEGEGAEAMRHGHNDHDHRDHHHERHIHEPPSRTVLLERDVLARNSRLAEHNRGWLAGRGVAAFNLVSSPGAGKTTLLERTVRELGWPVAVIEGDQATEHDAIRVRAAGARAVQVTTGAVCHLDAHMVGHALEELDPRAGTVVFIENVGNLICPAMFDLGERAKVLVASVTEGDDKPAKYPHMFAACELILLNKVDLLPHVRFDPGRFVHWVQTVNRDARVLPVSATHGDGLQEWYEWVRA
jgi:hydrogenase nickel incorporation protein HypB